MKKILFILIPLLLGGAFLYFLNISKSSSQKLITENETEISTQEAAKPFGPYQAAFAIFTNGTFRVFTQAMYHNRSTGVFIEAPNPNIVQVNKDGITWGDFFNTLPFKLTSQCLTTGTGETFCEGKNGRLRFYLNGFKTDNLLDLLINPGDQALITFGNENDAQIQNQILQIPQITAVLEN